MATTPRVPWTIAQNKIEGYSVLSYTDPLTGKAVKYNFATAAAANAWAYANVLILPAGAKIIRQPNPAIAGGATYDVVLANGESASFANPTEIGNWLVSKIGYATVGGQINYENAQKGQVPLGDTKITSPYQTGGHPAQTGLEGATPAATGTSSASRSGGVTLAPETGAASGIVPTDYSQPPAGLGLGGGGGGGGGPGAPNAPTSPLPADASMADVETYIRANYGYEAWMLDIPELKDLLFRSLTTGPWDDAKYQGELDKTTWWQQNGQSVFAWNNLEGSDPATASRRIDAKAGQVSDMAKTAGLTSFDNARSRQVARDALRYTWSDDQIKTVIANEFNYQPSPDGTTPAVGGEIIATANGVKALAHDYLLPMTEAQAVNFAKSIYVGELTQDGLKATFAAQAAARFPALAESIGNGVTPAQFFSTYQAQIGTLLEKPADAIDFVSDPRWQKVVDFIDPKGQRRPMTLSETDNYVRSLPEWDTTKNARDQAYAFTQFLGQKFGKVAS